MVDSGEYLGRV